LEKTCGCKKIELIAKKIEKEVMNNHGEDHLKGNL
jgi:hypothetical protein